MAALLRPARLRRPPARVGVVALVATVAVGLGACGSTQSAGNRYVAAVNSAQRQFADAVGRMPGALAPGRVSNSSPQSTRSFANAYRDALQTVLARLRAIRPPSNVADLHRQLIDQLASYGAAVSAAVPSLAARDAPTRLTARQRLLGAVQLVGAKIAGTLDAINTRLGR